MGRPFAVLLLFIGVAVSSARADFVDQSQTINNIAVAIGSQADMAQSFQQTNNNITGASLELRNYLGSGGNTGDITISLYDKLPTLNSGASLLASGTALGVGPNGTAMVSWNRVNITPDLTYYLVFTSSNSQLQLGGSNTNTYSRGQAFINPGYQSYPQYDFAFQTFAATAVPEPSSIVLIGLGICGVGVGVRVARRRRATACIPR